jgi:hypothetical protein
LPSPDAADVSEQAARGEGDDVVQALMVALGVVVLDKVAEHGAQMTVAEGDYAPTHSCLIDRTNLSA